MCCFLVLSGLRVSLIAMCLFLSFHPKSIIAFNIVKEKKEIEKFTIFEEVKNSSCFPTGNLLLF